MNKGAAAPQTCTTWPKKKRWLIKKKKKKTCTTFSFSSSDCTFDVSAIWGIFWRVLEQRPNRCISDSCKRLESLPCKYQNHWIACQTPRIWFLKTLLNLEWYWDRLVMIYHTWRGLRHARGLAHLPSVPWEVLFSVAVTEILVGEKVKFQVVTFQALPQYSPTLLAQTFWKTNMLGFELLERETFVQIPGSHIFLLQALWSRTRWHQLLGKSCICTRTHRRPPKSIKI